MIHKPTINCNLTILAGVQGHSQHELPFQREVLAAQPRQRDGHIPPRVPDRGSPERTPPGDRLATRPPGGGNRPPGAGSHTRPGDGQGVRGRGRQRRALVRHQVQEGEDTRRADRALEEPGGRGGVHAARQERVHTHGVRDQAQREGESGLVI